jgi:4-aminobutyrate aminotransferase/(S)-3-amino-2-methylpropionate transaminase
MAYTNSELQHKRPRVIPQGHASKTQSYVHSARGATVWDVEGREFIDFAGGIGVMNVGHSHPRVVEALQEQAALFTHTCFMVQPYPSVLELAEKLCRATPGDFAKTALFVNSGAEAVENAVKIARYVTKRPAVIAFENGYHGRTLLTMSLTSKVKPYKLGFGPFAPEVYRMPYAYCYRCPYSLNYPECGVVCADRVKEVFINHVAPESTAAMIVEPVAGEGGFITPPKEFFAKLKAVCEEHGIVFIADEIQSGMGRTGTMFAMEQMGVTPDLVTVAKSLAAGMPLSAVVGRQELMNAVHAGGLGGTYGGNPLACSAGLAVFEIFERDNLLDKSQALGTKLKQRFDAWAGRFSRIGEVRGLGPMIALELVKDRSTREPFPEGARAMEQFAFEHGLILLACGTHGNVIRVLMPLVITDQELEQGLAVMEEGLEHVESLG